MDQPAFKELEFGKSKFTILKEIENVLGVFEW